MCIRDSMTSSSSATKHDRVGSTSEMFTLTSIVRYVDSVVPKTRPEIFRTFFDQQMRKRYHHHRPLKIIQFVVGLVSLMTKLNVQFSRNIFQYSQKNNYFKKYLTSS